MANEAGQVPYSPEKANPLDGMSDQQLLDSIKSADAALYEDKTPTAVLPVPAVPAVPAAKTVTVEQPKPTEQVKAPQAVTPSETEVKPPIVEPKLAEATQEQINDLLAKKHINLAQITKLYTDLERDYSRIRQDPRLRSPEVAPAQPAVGSENPNPFTPDVDASFVQDFNRAPVATMANMLRILQANDPKVKEQNLHNTVVELSNSPETALFNLPEVQEEIKQVLNERPELKANLSENLPVAMDTALGRLLRSGKININAFELGKKSVEQANSAKASAVVESAGNPPPVPPSEVNPDTLPLDELRSYIAQQIRNLG